MNPIWSQLQVEVS